MKLQPAVSPWARGSPFLPAPRYLTPPLTLHPTNPVCNWEPQSSHLPTPGSPRDRSWAPSRTRPTPSAASCCCCIPRGMRGVPKLLRSPLHTMPAAQGHVATSEARERRQVASRVFLKSSTKIKPTAALGSSRDLLASARTPGTPFPRHPRAPHDMPGLASPSPEIPPRAGRQPPRTDPTCEQIPGRAGA